MCNFRKIKGDRVFMLMMACLVIVVYVRLEYETKNSQQFLGGSTLMTPEHAPAERKSVQKVYHFPHFLKTLKNPCYLERHEEELFHGLVDMKTDTLTNKWNNSFALVEFKENGSGVKDNLRCLPYYFVLGWPKCGTSDLYAKMMVHPHILRPSTKEPMWYNKLRFDVNAEKAVQILTRSLNKQATYHIAHHIKRNKTSYVRDIVGDHSTHTIDMWTGHQNIRNYQLNYSFGIPELNRYAPPLVTYSNAQLIKRLMPDVKLIILMRDPVERFYSLYRMHEATSPEDFHNGAVNGIHWWRSCEKEGIPLGECMYTKPRLTTFTPSINCTWKSRAIASARRSIYHLYLTEWLQVFPKQQFLFLRFEDYMSKEIDTITNAVFPFLGAQKMGKEGIRKMAAIHRLQVTSSRNNSAGEPINHNYRSPMMNKTRDLLRDFYKPYNVKLAVLLNDTRYTWGY